MRGADSSSLLVSAILLCLGSRSVSGADALPDWLAAAGRVDIGHFGDGSEAVVIGQWTDFTADASGKFASARIPLTSL